MRKNESASKGICYLAGAGPGDLGMVTLRCKEVIERADVLLFDYLCNPRMLRWAPQGCEILYVGKKAGDHTLPQDQINALIVERTRAGKTVVRLKGGDPFVFGRGGEEAQELAAAGLRFEVIPAVSSAIAAPAYAGIPVTHREHTVTFTVFTGHEDPTKEESHLDFDALAKNPGTRVMLMGVERLRSITGELLARGAAPETPVALVRWGSTPRQETLTGRLDTIADLVAARGFKAPAVAVFGSVVTLRDELNWFEKRPLFGKRIVVTRTRQQAGKLSDRLTELGADVIEIPTIEIAPPTDRVQFVRMIADAHTYDWIVFTSANGVTAFFEAFFKLHKDARALGRPKLAAIGPATAAKVREYRFDVDLQPAEFVAESIVEAFKEIASVENETILVVQAEAGREIVAPALSEMGAIVDEVAAYTTLPVTTDATGEASRFREEGADIITFTSSSTVENFLALNLPWPTGMKTASIGPITSETMRQKGLQVDCEATRSDIPGLIEAIVKDLA